MKQIRIYVVGDVIGVGFRSWTAYQAKKLGVNGWVKNVFDKPEIFGATGGVEALLQAEEKSLNKLVKRINRGPGRGDVESIVVKEEEPVGLFQTFEILR